MPIPIDTRKKPASVKIHISTGAGLDIVWSDGHASHFDFAYLREQCPCATCNDERMKKQEFSDGSSTGPPVPSPLPMFKPRLRAQKATPVGNYAIQFDYSDGHSTGIYSYDYLRTMCPCEDCAREFRSPGHDLDSSINS